MGSFVGSSVTGLGVGDGVGSSVTGAGVGDGVGCSGMKLGTMKVKRMHNIRYIIHYRKHALNKKQKMIDKILLPPPPP